MFRSHRYISTQSLNAIKRKELIQTAPYINGKFIDRRENGSSRFAVYNPFDKTELASVLGADTEELTAAIRNISDSFEDFQFTTPRYRSNLLSKLNKAILDNSDDLARLITLENGKPLSDSLNEVKYAASFMEWYSEEAARINGLIISSTDPSKQINAYKLPIGPVGILTPWNFPLAMITRKLGASLAAGCTTLVKPASETPLTALAFAQLCSEAGVPDGVVNVVTADPAKTPLFGKLICEDPLIRKISFTGSTKVGKLLMQQSSSTVKKMSMELGGNAPFIVSNKCEDLDKAVDGLIASKFRSSGQTCVCPNRVYLHNDIHDQFVDLLIEKLKMYSRLGPGIDPSVTHGPLVNEKAVTKVESLVNDAVTKGACIKLGGKRRIDLGPTFYELTVLTNVTPEMEIYETEIFGPIASIIRFDKSPIDLAKNEASTNLEDVGLAGYFYSDNLKECKQVSRYLNVGMVGLNTGSISEAALPFGGVRCSGIGREGSVYGIDEYCITRSVVETI